MTASELFGDSINAQAATDAVRDVAWQYHMQPHEILYICLSDDNIRMASAIRNDVMAAYKTECQKYG